MKRRSHRPLRAPSALAWLCGAAVLAATPSLHAATIDWKGHTWQITSGGMAGVCNGSPANVTVDANGYLHLRISHDGSTWSAAELFTTDRLGFGTYQWQIDGPIDTFDKNAVLGLFPYGPAAGVGGDGTNEIDIEYSRWGQADGPNGDYTDYPASGATVGELSYTFSLTGSLSTSRFVWTNTSITDFLFDGLSAIGSSDAPLKTWTYMPSRPETNIPQAALPLGMNLWCFDAPPSDNNPIEIVIHDFEFVAEGAMGGAGGGGAGGGGAGGGGAGGAGAGGAGAGGAGAGAELGGKGGRAAAGTTGNGGAGSGRAGRSGGGASGQTSTPAAGAETSGGRAGTSGVPMADAGRNATGGAGPNTMADAGGPSGAGGSNRGGAGGSNTQGGAGSVAHEVAPSGTSRANGCGCRLGAPAVPLRDGAAGWLALGAFAARRRGAHRKRA